MARSLHFNDGAAWRRARSLWVHDGTAWRKSRAVYVHDGTAWRLSGASQPVNFSGAVYAYRFGASSSSASATFEANGSITETHSGASTTYTYGIWYDANETGIGASYWIRATLQGGLAPSSGGAMGVWLPLSGGQFWTYNSGTGGGASMRSGAVLFEISSNSAGTAIVCSGVYNFTAERES